MYEYSEESYSENNTSRASKNDSVPQIMIVNSNGPDHVIPNNNLGPPLSPSKGGHSKKRNSHKRDNTTSKRGSASRRASGSKRRSSSLDDARKIISTFS